MPLCPCQTSLRSSCLPRAPSLPPSSQFTLEPVLDVNTFPSEWFRAADLRGWTFLFLSRPARVTKLRALLASPHPLLFYFPFFTSIWVKHLLSTLEARIINSSLCYNNNPQNPHGLAQQKFISHPHKVWRRLTGALFQPVIQGFRILPSLADTILTGGIEFLWGKRRELS